MANIQNQEETLTKLDTPRKYNVIFHNDDYTPMEFVIELLMILFNKNPEDAFNITQTVHLNGKAIVGSYPKNIATMKVKKVQDIAKENEYPLKCTMEVE